MDKYKIIKIGEKISRKLGYNPIKNSNLGGLKNLVEKIGGEIIFEEWEKWNNPDQNLIEVRGKKDFSIYLPNILSSTRCQSRIAMRLSNYIIDSNKGKKQIIIKRKDYTSNAQQESSYFALGFLVPEKDFINACKKYQNDYKRLESIFFVPKSIISMRKNLLKEKDEKGRQF